MLYVTYGRFWAGKEAAGVQRPVAGACRGPSRLGDSRALCRKNKGFLGASRREVRGQRPHCPVRGRGRTQSRCRVVAPGRKPTVRRAAPGRAPASRATVARAGRGSGPRRKTDGAGRHHPGVRGSCSSASCTPDSAPSRNCAGGRRVLPTWPGLPESGPPLDRKRELSQPPGGCPLRSF